MEIVLTDRECIASAQEALNRMLASAGASLNHATTYKREWGERLREEIIGAAAEISLAKYLGVYRLPGLNEFHARSDVIADLECRGSHRRDARLIVRENDASDRRYVLVIGFPPCMTICGWIAGADAKRDQFLDNPNGYRQSWFVPQAELKPAELLKLIQ